jgi:hypothetical protein
MICKSLCYKTKSWRYGAPRLSDTRSARNFLFCSCELLTLVDVDVPSTRTEDGTSAGKVRFGSGSGQLTLNVIVGPKLCPCGVGVLLGCVVPFRRGVVAMYNA